MKLRFSSFLLALVMLFSLSSVSVASAAEMPAEVEDNELMLIPIEETPISYEDALDILGMTEAEAEGFSFYAVSENIEGIGETEKISRAANSEPITIPSNSNDAYRFDPVTVSRDNIGQPWLAGGTVMAWGAVVTGFVDKNNPVVINLFTGEGNGVYVYGVDIYGNDNGTGTYNGSAMKVTKGQKFHFEYHTFQTVTIYMVVAMQG